MTAVRLPFRTSARQPDVALSFSHRPKAALPPLKSSFPSTFTMQRPTHCELSLHALLASGVGTTQKGAGVNAPKTSTSPPAATHCSMGTTGSFSFVSDTLLPHALSNINAGTIKYCEKWVTSGSWPSLLMSAMGRKRTFAQPLVPTLSNCANHARIAATSPGSAPRCHTEPHAHRVDRDSIATSSFAELMFSRGTATMALRSY